MAFGVFLAFFQAVRHFPVELDIPSASHTREIFRNTLRSHRVALTTVPPSDQLLNCSALMSLLVRTRSRSSRPRSIVCWSWLASGSVVGMLPGVAASRVLLGNAVGSIFRPKSVGF